ncbi:hypothetical protein [Xanthomonas albilineans]|uniref:hypothetical protein n=1 Tax=Xanthomonas albilineans TaxID=29447 RepID=UPI0005F31B66|nr:hypothetical protein [Xanthomonas albilineans]
MTYRSLPHPATLTPEDRARWRDIIAGPRYAQQPHDLADGSRYYVAEETGRVIVTEFHGKSLKFDRFAFRTPDDVVQEIVRFIQRREQIATATATAAAAAAAGAERRAAAKRPHTLAVGDILVSSYAYEQTDVDFYEVVGVQNRTVTLRELAQEREASGPMSGHAVPRPGHYIGEPIRKRANPRNGVKLAAGVYAHPWDGSKVYWSNYA